MSTADKCASCAERKAERLGLDATIAQQRTALRAMQGRYERSEARVAELEVLADLVRKRCQDAVPEWAPELREALARLDAKETER